MLLGDWADLDFEEARRIETDEPGWIVQPKLDGVRALFHIEGGLAGRGAYGPSKRIPVSVSRLPAGRPPGPRRDGAARPRPIRAAR
jgi:hypothetical protein